MTTNKIMINDPLCTSIPVKDNGEKMVSLLGLDRLFLLHSTNVRSENICGNSKYPYARVTVRNMLKDAIANLETDYGVVLIESYRKYEFQMALFQKKVANIITDSGLPREKAEEEASLYVSNPDIYSPHVTGGAIDIGLIELSTMALVDVGNKFTHDDTAQTHYQNLTSYQNRNRKLIIDLMTSVGFVNYPYEWWHWSYGDKYWAMTKKESRAIYDSIKID